MAYAFFVVATVSDDERCWFGPMSPSASESLVHDLAASGKYRSVEVVTDRPERRQRRLEAAEQNGPQEASLNG